MRHLSDAWARRGEPNVLLVHYDDLLADLEGQMRWLAGRLAIAVPEQAWPALTQAATFGRMRDRADTLIAVPPEIRGRGRILPRGSSGAGREILSDEEMAGYYARAAQLAPPDMLEWLHSPPASAGCRLASGACGRAALALRLPAAHLPGHGRPAGPGGPPGPPGKGQAIGSGGGEAAGNDRPAGLVSGQRRRAPGGRTGSGTGRRTARRTRAAHRAGRARGPGRRR